VAEGPLECATKNNTGEELLKSTAGDNAGKDPLDIGPGQEITIDAAEVSVKLRILT
jgi:hypothetical protein